MYKVTSSELKGAFDIKPGIISRIYTSPGLMAAIAFGIRFAVVLALYENQFSVKRDHFGFGWEIGRIARSVALGHGFSSPLHGPTGPTAWAPPVYVYLVAGVFKVFGVYTVPSALVILGLNSLFSALTCLIIFQIAEESFGRAIALRAGWVWALFPYAINFAASRVWGDCLNAFLFGLLFLMVLRLERRANTRTWLIFGLLAGITLLACPSILPVLSILIGWVCYRLYRRQVQWGRSLGLAVLIMVAVLTPWFVRNYYTFNRFIPFRSNFWLEMRVGNTGDLSDLIPDWSHPSTNKAEMNEFSRLGELEYMAFKRRQALDYISAYPDAFITLTLRRIVCVWTGFWSLEYFAVEPIAVPHAMMTTMLSILMAIGLYKGWRQSKARMMPFVLTLLGFPLIYYITHSQAEYRHPIDTIIVVLAAYGTSGLWKQAIEIFRKRLSND